VWLNAVLKYTSI